MGQADLVEQAADLAVLLAGGSRCPGSRAARAGSRRRASADRARSTGPGTSSAGRAAPCAARCRAAEDLLALERDPPAVGLLDADDQLAERRLAAAGLADEAERLARVEVQVDARDRLDRGDPALQDRARRSPGYSRTTLVDLAAGARQFVRSLGDRGAAPATRSMRAAAMRPVDRMPAGELVRRVIAAERRLLARGTARSRAGSAAAKRHPGGGLVRSGGRPRNRHQRLAWRPDPGAGSSRAAPGCRGGASS